MASLAHQEQDQDLGRDLDPELCPRSVKERLDAAESGLDLLAGLYRRQELLVRNTLLLLHRDQDQRDLETALLLQNQLGLMTRDSGLSQLQEVDQLISELRLCPLSHDQQAESDSRPSSGFFDLSEGACLSLSNSSNSVFSECLCLVPDADGRRPATGGRSSCLDCDLAFAGLAENPSRSAPDPGSSDPPSVSRSKHQCCLCFRTNMHTVHSPAPLHRVGHGAPYRDDGDATDHFRLSEVRQSSSWSWSWSWSWSGCSQPLAQTQKRLDSYIISLLQRRVPPTRTSIPRTSISTEPLKRQPNLCVRHMTCSGPASVPGSGPAPSYVPGSGPTSVPGSVPGSGLGCKNLKSSGGLSPRWAESVVSQPEEQEPADVSRTSSSDAVLRSSPTDTEKKNQNKTSPGSIRYTTGPDSAPKHSRPPCDLSSDPQNNNDAHKSQRSVSELPCHWLSAQSPEETGSGDRSYRIHIWSRKVKGAVATTRIHSSDQHRVHRSGSTKDGESTVRTCRRGKSHPASSSRIKRISVSVPEGGRQDRQRGSTLSKHCNHGNNRRHHSGPHQQACDQLVGVAKPKHNPKRRTRVTRDIPQDETCGRLLTCRGRRAAHAQQTGSDSEYSAECASLFHSTVADTSEDNASNFTANRFGDSEDESATCSNTEEGAGGGATKTETVQNQQGAGQEVRRSKTLVKMRASRNLKKKILRFRSGSFKLITTI